MNTPEKFLQDGGVIASHGITIMSRETYMESIGYAPDGKPLTVVAQFDQGEWWRQKSGTWIRIADMAPGHRYNTAAMLMRAAAVHGYRYATGFSIEAARHDGGEMAHDSLERIADELWESVRNDPAGWLRGTGLYRALTAGLAINGDGTQPWQATGLDPVTGKATEVPPPFKRVCGVPDCGCSGEAHA